MHAIHSHTENTYIHKNESNLGKGH